MAIRLVLAQMATLALSMMLFIGLVVAYAETMDWIIRKGTWTKTKDCVFAAVFIAVWFLLTILMMVTAANLAL